MQSHGASLRDRQNEKRDTDLTLASSPENLGNCMKKGLKDICSPNLDRLDRLQEECGVTGQVCNSVKNRARTMPRRLAMIIEANSEMANY